MKMKLGNNIYARNYHLEANRALNTLIARIASAGDTLETSKEHLEEMRRLAHLGLLDTMSLGYIAGAYGTSKWYNIKGATGDLAVTRATNGTRENRAGVIDTLGNNLTRADFDAGVLKGNWVESAATNLLLRSEAFDNAYWTKQQNGTGLVPVVTANVATAPDGTTTADRVLFDQGAGVTSGDFSFIRSGNISVTVQSYTASLYIKADTADDIGKQILIRHVGAGAYGVLTLTADWQRVDRTESSPIVGNRTIEIGVRTGEGGNASQVSALLWQAQLETGSTATSYIKTVATAVTRNADNISKTGIASEIGQTEGTLMVKMIALREKTATSRIIQINDGTSDNRILVWIGADGLMRAGSSISGAFTQWFVLSSIITGDVNVALSYKSGDTQMRVNGVDMGVYDTPFTLNTMSQINIGHQLGANQLNDTVYSAYVWETAKTDEELIALTTL